MLHLRFGFTYNQCKSDDKEFSLINNIDKLISISTQSLGEGISGNLLKEDRLPKALFSILKKKNGFFAFESALRVFPLVTTPESIGLNDWNSKDCWIKYYEGETCDAYFFAEDIFGMQFCIIDDTVCTFDPEIGLFEKIANNIEEWVNLILEDYNFMTGFTIAHNWQVNNGPINNDQRLIPKIPFNCGGEYKIENLYKMNSVDSMRLRADLALQLKNLSDGSKIHYRISDFLNT